VLLTLRRATADGDEHDDRPQPSDPRRPSYSSEPRQKRQHHAGHDEGAVQELSTPHVPRREVVEVCHLVRKDRGRLVGLEQLQERIAHRHRRPADRRQRHRVHEP